jgi:two-component system, NarL family, sensor histidine kinase UhpB
MGPINHGERPAERYRRAQHAAREEERRRMATDLHDGVGQVLSRVRIELMSVREELAGGHPAASRIEELAAALDDTAGDVRHIANELRPSLLDKHGLVPALEWLCGEFDRRAGIACSFATDAREAPIGPERAVLVYRIVEEALRNASGHAPGASVTVTVAHRGDELRLEVADDGAGFDPAEGTQPDALRLAGMRERAELLGARLEIAPREGDGTSVLLTLPVA